MSVQRTKEQSSQGVSPSLTKKGVAATTVVMDDLNARGEPLIEKTGSESFSSSTRRTRALRKAHRQNKKAGRQRNGRK